MKHHLFVDFFGFPVLGFEPKIPVFEQLKTEHSTGFAAAVIGLNFFLGYNF
jgi:hypothetical protein